MKYQKTQTQQTRALRNTFRGACVAAILFLINDFAMATSFQVPHSWYAGSDSPIDSNLIKTTSSNGDSETQKEERAIEGGISKLVTTQKSILEQIEISRADSTPSLSPVKIKSPWELKFVGMDMGVSGSGTLGLSLKGTSLATLYVKRTKVPNSQKPMITTERVTEGDSAIAVADITKVDPVVKLVMATHKVRSEKKLKAQLEKTFRGIQMLVMGLQADKAQEWPLTKLRFDITVSASGVIVPPYSVGGAVKVRFEFVPEQMQLAYSESMMTEFPKMKTANDSLKTLVAGISASLGQWAGRHQNDPMPLHLSTVRVALGLNSAFNVGLVKTGVGGAFHAIFTHRPKPTGFHIANTNTAQELNSQTHLPALWTMMDTDGDQQLGLWDVATASPSEISMYDSRTSSSAMRVKEWSIRPLNFEKGLERANSIGSTLMKVSDRVFEHSKWSVAKLMLYCQFDVGGDLGVVALTGTVGTEFAFLP